MTDTLNRRHFLRKIIEVNAVISLQMKKIHLRTRKGPFCKIVESVSIYTYCDTITSVLAYHFEQLGHIDEASEFLQQIIT